MNIIVNITHTDADGITSAYIVNSYFHDKFKVETFFCNYCDDFKNIKDFINKNHENIEYVIFTDFIPDDASIIDDFSKKALRTVIILDHHASKKDQVLRIANGNDKIEAIVEEIHGISGAMITHQTFFPNKKTPKMLQTVSNFDTFFMPNGKEQFYKKELPLMFGFMNYHSESPHIDEKLKKAFDDYYYHDNSDKLDDIHDEMIINGNTIFNYNINQWKKQAKQNAFLANVYGIKAICMNIIDLGSMQFDSIATKYDDRILFGFYLKGNGQWSISIYNDSKLNRCNVGEIAKKYFNGGGHKESAGGVFDGDIFSILKRSKEQIKFD